MRQWTVCKLLRPRVHGVSEREAHEPVLRSKQHFGKALTHDKRVIPTHPVDRDHAFVVPAPGTSRSPSTVMLCA